MDGLRDPALSFNCSRQLLKRALFLIITHLAY